MLVKERNAKLTSTQLQIITYKSNFNGSCQKWMSNAIFITLNIVLTLLINVFIQMIGVKIGCHFNNRMVLIKKYN